MTTEATSHTPDEGLRILARIIARDWAARQLGRKGTVAVPCEEMGDHADARASGKSG